MRDGVVQSTVPYGAAYRAACRGDRLCARGYEEGWR